MCVVVSHEQPVHACTLPFYGQVTPNHHFSSFHINTKRYYNTNFSNLKMATDSSVPMFSRFSEKEVKLVSLLGIQARCGDHNFTSPSCTAASWSAFIKKELLDAASDWVATLINRKQLMKLPLCIQDNKKERHLCSRIRYNMATCVFRACVDEVCAPLSKRGSWETFEKNINKRIDVVAQDVLGRHMSPILLSEFKYFERFSTCYQNKREIAHVLDKSLSYESETGESSDSCSEYSCGKESETSESESSESSESESESESGELESEKDNGLAISDVHNDILMFLVEVGSKGIKGGKQVGPSMNTRNRQNPESDGKMSKLSKEFMQLVQSRQRKTGGKGISESAFQALPETLQKKCISMLRRVNAEQSDLPLIVRLLQAELPPSVVNEAMQRHENARMESEGSKYKTWLNALLKLPFNKFVEAEHAKPANHSSPVDSRAFFEKARKQLDDAVYGHSEAKNMLIKYIAQMARCSISNKKQSKGMVLGIQGPCGNGKTTLIEKGVSKVMNLPFAAIPLGGATDSSFLNGHSYTYEGSVWGQIADVLMRKKCSNLIIYMDELDKVSNTPKGQEIINQLIHMTDPSQNSHFQDRYFGNIDIDLSHVTWVFSYNDASNINYILRDRSLQKSRPRGSHFRTRSTSRRNSFCLTFAKRLVIPQVKLTTDTISHLVESYTYEGGVRKIKELLFDICRSLNIDDLTGKVSISNKRRCLSKDGRFSVPMNLISEYLKDKRQLPKEKIHTKPCIGRINGLYATSRSDMGGVIPIETGFVTY